MLNFEAKKEADKKDAFYRKCLPAALTNRQKEVNGGLVQGWIIRRNGALFQWMKAERLELERLANRNRDFPDVATAGRIIGKPTKKASKKKSPKKVSPTMIV